MSHRCKICNITDPKYFYKASSSTCKICREPENRRNGITSVTKLQAVESMCRKCGQVKPIDKFNLSKTGFRNPNCIDCHHKKPGSPVIVSNGDDLVRRVITFGPVVDDDVPEDVLVTYKLLKDSVDFKMYGPSEVKALYAIFLGLVMNLD